MTKVFANSGYPDQTPHSALFSSYPFEGLQTVVRYGLYCPLIYKYDGLRYDLQNVSCFILIDCKPS